ncbi:TIGR03086 family metal-binding protein [Streptomyces mesophilus]|uniref:TIGR03086 family metal-binding protein n=1 Tax=Streptomyces mesophilus TaxID=1775132 RepID=UPI003321CEAA
MPSFDFTAQTRLVARLADRVTEAQLDLPTPCPELPVRNLLGHLVGLTAAFRDAARKDLGPTTDTPPGDTVPDLGPAWRGDLSKNLQELAEAWQAPEAWEGFTRAGGVDLPAEVAAQVAMDELVVHGWDLARATGQEYAPGEAELQVSYALLSPDADDRSALSEQEAADSIFGPPVPVPPSAPLLDRVIGLSGRDPHWAAPRR